MKILISGWFARFARKQGLTADVLRAAVSRAEHGLIDASLGEGVIKQRIGRSGSGKSGGYRAIIFYSKRRCAIFVFGYAKSDRANIRSDELLQFKKASKVMQGLTDDQLQTLVQTGQFEEVRHGHQVQDRCNGCHPRIHGGIARYRHYRYSDHAGV